MPVTPRVKTCVDCHEDFTATMPHQQERCPDCQYQRTLANNRAHRRNNQRVRGMTITEYPQGDEYVDASSPVWGNLAEAIIHDAISTRRQYGHSATGEVRWLMGKQCQLLCDCIGFDHNIIMDWIKQGCPSAEGENRGRYKRKHAEAAHV